MISDLFGGLHSRLAVLLRGMEAVPYKIWDGMFGALIMFCLLLAAGWILISVASLIDIPVPDQGEIRKTNGRLIAKCKAEGGTPVLTDALYFKFCKKQPLTIWTSASGASPSAWPC